MNNIMKEFFDNPENYKNIEPWEDRGLLAGLSIYHKRLLSNYYYNFISMDYSLIDESLGNYYLPCLRRVFDVVINSHKLSSTLSRNNLDEVQLDLYHFIDYINSNLKKTIDGLSHLEEGFYTKYPGSFDKEAEACAIVTKSYEGIIRNIYFDDNRLKEYLRNLKVNSIID